MRLALFLALFSAYILAQNVVKGTVYDGDNLPLEDVSVFVDGASYNTISDLDGNFTLNLPNGNYQINFRKADFTSASIWYATDKKVKIKAILTPLTELDAVEVVPLDDATWRFYYSQFKRNFLGTTLNSKHCKILNPTKLNFSKRDKVLYASSSEPLRVKNKRLGYEVVFYLDDFFLDYNSRLTKFEGISYYKNLKKKVSNSVKRKRKDAHMGSTNHFVRAMYKGDLSGEGFTLRRIKQLTNPQRPPQETIDSAKQVLRDQTLGGSFAFDMNSPLGQIMRKAKLPKYINQLYTTPLEYDAFLKVGNEKKLFVFKDLIEVEYLDGSDRNVISLSDSIEIFTNGNYFPSAIIAQEGDWTQQKVCDMLPLDYRP